MSNYTAADGIITSQTANALILGGGASAINTSLVVPTAPSKLVTTSAGVPSWTSVAPVAKTASYTVLVVDNGTTFSTTGATGAVTFTLPAVTSNAGLDYTFMNTVGQNMLVTAPAGTMVAFNNAAATTVALQTANNLIGSGFRVVCDGVKWLAMPIGVGTVTIT